MPLKVTTNYIPQGHPNRPGIKMTSKPLARICHGTSNYNRGAGDEMHQSYVGRPYTKVWNQTLKKYEYFEKSGKPFVFGCTHVYIDADSATIVIPLDEYCPGAGDRSLPYTAELKGQKPLAKELFNNLQNYCTWQYELCMNDMTVWHLVLANAIEFIYEYMPDNIPDVRHYDVTGKVCPIPFVDLKIKEVDPRWVKYRTDLRAALIVPHITPVESAINVLAKAGIITTPKYWLDSTKDGKTASGVFVGQLIMNVAKYIKEKGVE